jgi:hypothetical protein
MSMEICNFKMRFKPMKCPGREGVKNFIGKEEGTQ